MSRRSIIISVAVVAALALFAALAYSHTQRDEREKQEVQAMVAAFGDRLKNVALLAPPDEVRSQLQLQYAEYLTPELLSRWQDDPAQALGRSVSSPWPDRIEVLSVEAQGQGTYIVEGRVIEVTSADGVSEPAAAYPVTFIVERIGEAWLIADVQRAP